MIHEEFKEIKKKGLSTWGTTLETYQRITCGFVVFTGQRCPHSFTECITTIFRDEVILFPQNTWGYLFSGSWYHDVIQHLTSKGLNDIIAITCMMPIPTAGHCWGNNKHHHHLCKKTKTLSDVFVSISLYYEMWHNFLPPNVMFQHCCQGTYMQTVFFSWLQGFCLGHSDLKSCGSTSGST